MLNLGKGKLTVELLESDRTIQKKIYGSIAQDLNRKIKKNTNKTKRRFIEAVEGWVRSQPEIGSLVGKGVFGSLNAQFGLPVGTAENAVNQIVFAVVKSMEITLFTISDFFKISLITTKSLAGELVSVTINSKFIFSNFSLALLAALTKDLNVLKVYSFFSQSKILLLF